MILAFLSKILIPVMNLKTEFRTSLSYTKGEKPHKIVANT